MEIHHNRSSNRRTVGAGMHVNNIGTQRNMNRSWDLRLVSAGKDTIVGEFEMAVGKLSADNLSRSTAFPGSYFCRGVQKAAGLFSHPKSTISQTIAHVF
jgi:hypothetical protein